MGVLKFLLFCEAPGTHVRGVLSKSFIIIIVVIIIIIIIIMLLLLYCSMWRPCWPVGIYDVCDEPKTQNGNIVKYDKSQFQCFHRAFHSVSYRGGISQNYHYYCLVAKCRQQISKNFSKRKICLKLQPRKFPAATFSKKLPTET